MVVSIYFHTRTLRTLRTLIDSAPKSTPNNPNNPTLKMLEIFGDEWLLTAAYHWRWAYSTDPAQGQSMPTPAGGEATAAMPSRSGHTPRTSSDSSSSSSPSSSPYLPHSHRKFNALQWGNFLLPDGETGRDKRAAGSLLFDAVMYRGGAKSHDNSFSVP